MVADLYENRAPKRAAPRLGFAVRPLLGEHQPESLQAYLKSQVAQKNKPPYFEEANDGLKVAHHCEPLAFQLKDSPEDAVDNTVA